MRKPIGGTTLEGTVNGMTSGPGIPPPDLYQLLGVDPAASGEEIARAWRQRARAEHPDARPGDTAAPGRFRLLAEAYRVLGDPARRAAYDQAAGHTHTPRPRPAAPPAQERPWPSAADPVTGVPEPPLRAGPVRVEPLGGGPASAPARGETGDEWLAGLLARVLGGRERPW